MEHTLRGFIKMVRRKEKAVCISQMAHITKDNLMEMRLMASVLTNGLMGELTLENGTLIRCMVKAILLGQQVEIK